MGGGGGGPGRACWTGAAVEGLEPAEAPSHCVWEVACGGWFTGTEALVVRGWGAPGVDVEGGGGGGAGGRAVCKEECTLGATKCVPFDAAVCKIFHVNNECT